MQTDRRPSAILRLPILAALAVSLAAGANPVFGAGDAIGQRPYELDWAGRVQDHVPPLVDFEKPSPWRVEVRNAVARFERTREQQIWGDYVGKLVYHGTETRTDIRIRPPAPVPIREPFDAVTLWCYGNNWGWTTDPTTPRVALSVLFADAAGGEFAVPMATVNWKEWHCLHRRLSTDEAARIKTGAAFTGLLIAGGSNRDDRVLFFDNLAVYTESFPPLSFEPRPQRGVAVFPGQSAGLNAGPGRLPFPIDERTILPPTRSDRFTNTVRSVQLASGPAFELTHQGGDGALTYRLTPHTGTWADLAVDWTPVAIPRAGSAPDPQSAHRLQPCVDGGVRLASSGGPVLPDKAEHLGTTLEHDIVQSRWRLNAGPESADVTYVYRLWAKSLVIDVRAVGGSVAEVRFGRARGDGLDNPRLVTNPFYPAEGGRPAVLVCGPSEAPFFLAGAVDWYRSNGSVLWAVNSLTDHDAVYHGGTRYVPLTNGRRNDCFERFFLTLSPCYEEVLPSIPNPPSPWRPVTGTRLWRAHGASDRGRDRQYWADVHRHGMTQVVITDHETLWRDGGESFTFRTRAAPGKGGDPGAYAYARFLQDTLGFVYGPYNNFTDFAPVNEFWNTDTVARDPHNQLQRAWMRCYAPKPARAVEFCSRLAPQIQQKFQFSTAYCDVHTAVAPWHRVDYDPRVPGAGTFAAVFYAYGEIMLLQKQAWNGPVYSEGNYHCFYMGLTDGNYGQDQSYRPADNPWLVDFDLRRMHDLGCNFGMGNLDMFYANAPQPRRTREERDTEIDRFLAATVAFGHPGFLVMEGGMANALRSYYLLQQLQSRYCLTNALEILYATDDGRLLETSHAVATGAYRRSQVVTRYADGTVTAANGHRSERLRALAFGRLLDLPPNGFAGWSGDGTLDVFCGDTNGHRADLALTPAYRYADGRGVFTRFPQAAADGPAVCRALPDRQFEIFTHGTVECGFALDVASAVALDKEGKELGPAQWRRARGLTYLIPSTNAFSYRLTAQPHAADREPDLAADRDVVVPGEQVTVRGRESHEIRIPSDAKPGQRLWLEFENRWIDFTVTSLADLDARLEGDRLQIRVVSHLPNPTDFTLQAGTATRSFTANPREKVTLDIDLGDPSVESTITLPIELRSDAMAQRLELGLRCVREVTPLVPMPGQSRIGMVLRGQKETAEFGASGATVHAQTIECGGVAKAGLFMHPPWQTGTGLAFALYDPIQLPTQPRAAFRASVGKRDGSDPGDGILFRLTVVDPAGIETVVAHTTVTRHEWLPLEANLSPWAGQRIRLKLIADAGPRDDSTGDWAAWADLRIETLEPVLHRRLTPAATSLSSPPAAAGADRGR
ncbi:MAG TPA: hypothetical protein PKM73_09060 [Verrucomicrobiota bacterium]|nr:hypothetical protein [Verrucomicrobiota bacterium]HNU50070.1 hypothetical protein [Verrucomicrobiota bacterium]